EDVGNAGEGGRVQPHRMEPTLFPGAGRPAPLDPGEDACRPGRLTAPASAAIVRPPYRPASLVISASHRVLSHRHPPAPGALSMFARSPRLASILAAPAFTVALTVVSASTALAQPRPMPSGGPPTGEEEPKPAGVAE